MSFGVYFARISSHPPSLRQLTSGDVKFEWLKSDVTVTPNHPLNGHHKLFSVLLSCMYTVLHEWVF